MKPSHIAALLLAALPFAVLLARLPAATPPPEPAYSLEVDTDYATLSRSNPENLVLKVGLTGHRRPGDNFYRAPMDLAIVLDRSGSMSGEKIEMARRAALQAFRTLRPEDRVTLIAYSSGVETILPLTRVDRVGDPYHYIDQIRSSGNTAIYAGVNQAAAELRRGSRDRDSVSRIVLLSDGLANVGPSSVADFDLLGESLSREGITVSTVGLGLDYNEDLMAALAQGGQGNIYFVENARDLPRIFDSELGDAASLVAQDAVLEIECRPGFRPIRVIGREGRIDGHKVTIEISQLYADRQKYALIECVVAGDESAEEVDFAAITARLTDLQEKRPVTLARNAQVAFSDRPEDRQKSVNIAVQREVVYNRIAIAQDEAVELADQGKPQAASAVIADLNSWITSNNADWNDEDIAARNRDLARQAREIEEEGIDKKTRKEMRSSSYQSRTQQSYK